MARQPVDEDKRHETRTYSLPRDQIRWVDEKAGELGVNRSKLVSALIAREMSKGSEEHSDAA